MSKEKYDWTLTNEDTGLGWASRGYYRTLAGALKYGERFAARRRLEAGPYMLKIFRNEDGTGTYVACYEFRVRPKEGSLGREEQLLYNRWGELPSGFTDLETLPMWFHEL